MPTKLYQAHHGLIQDHHVSLPRMLALVACAYLYWLVSLALGFTGHFLYFVYSRIRTLLTTPTAFLTTAYHTIAPIHFKPLPQTTDESAPLGSISHPYRIIVIGAGYSGLCLAIKLKEAGCTDYTVLERDVSIGGTWYANQFPGLSVDIPSYLYSFSFAQKHDWSYKHGRGPEIHDYIQSLVDRYDIRSQFQLQSEVSELRWADDKQLWQVKLKTGTTHYARVVCNGQGALSDPAIPKHIPGIDSFKGPAFHSGHWDHSAQLKGKRIAVIGSGASSVQVVPAIVDKVRDLVLFQRTPQWVSPRNDFAIPGCVQTVFRTFPVIQSFVRAVQYHGREGIHVALRLPFSPVHKLLASLAYASLYFSVKDVELRRKLTPNFMFGCKRMLVSDDWYAALQKPNVTVVTDRIAHVEADGVVTRTGTKHNVDVLVFCTGYQIQRADYGLLPTYGRDGVDIRSVWKNGMYAYKTVTLQGFPNLFWLLGPNSGVGHTSMIHVIESVTQYVMDAVQTMEEQNIAVFEVKSDKVAQFNKTLQQHLQKTVWHVGGCTSWYNDKRGLNTTMWPSFSWVFRYVLRRFDVENYNVSKC